MPAVKSSMVSHVEYDAKAKTLVVTWAKGGTGTYHDVPKSAYEKLMAAESVGKHLIANFRGNDAYRYAKG